jgi:hypothetical protein
MNGQLQRFALDVPALYRIRVFGRLRPAWSEWFEDMEVSVADDGEQAPTTTLTGIVPDQAALHGVLNRIRDLGLPLIAVELVRPVPPEERTDG